MRTIILVAVSVLGLSQTACEMKIASDNVVTANVSAPNSSVFGPGSIPNLLQSPTAVPIAVGGLPSATPSGATPVTTPNSPSNTTPMVPITIASVQPAFALSDAQKSNAVRAGISSTFARQSVSTFQNARSPSSVSVKPQTRAAAQASSVIAAIRDPKTEITRTVESAR